MWSVGVIMYLVLSSSPPFDGQTDDEILEAVCNEYIDFSQCTVEDLNFRQARIGQPLYLSSTWLSISKEAKSLISKLLSKVPRYQHDAETRQHHILSRCLKQQESAYRNRSARRSVVRSFRHIR
jgi:serine/threonine protein kinase